MWSLGRQLRIAIAHGFFAWNLMTRQVKLMSLTSSCIVLRKVFLGRSLFLLPVGFQSRTCFSILRSSFLSVCPTHFHFRSFVPSITADCFVLFHRSSFDPMLRICPRPRLMNVCTFLVRPWMQATFHYHINGPI